MAHFLYLAQVHQERQYPQKADCYLQLIEERRGR